MTFWPNEKNKLNQHHFWSIDWLQVWKVFSFVFWTILLISVLRILRNLFMYTSLRVFNRADHKRLCLDLELKNSFVTILFSNTSAKVTGPGLTLLFSHLRLSDLNMKLELFELDAFQSSWGFSWLFLVWRKLPPAHDKCGGQTVGLLL